MKACEVIEEDSGHWRLDEDGRTIYRTTSTTERAAKAELAAWYAGFNHGLLTKPRPTSLGLIT